MNHRSTGLIASKAIIGYLHYKLAEGLAPVTVDGYVRDLKLWIEFQGDLFVEDITTHQLISFLNFLRSEYVRSRITGGNERKLTPKQFITFMSASHPFLQGQARNSIFQIP